jgi:hypothetical protein
MVIYSTSTIVGLIVSMTACKHVLNCDSICRPRYTFVIYAMSNININKINKEIVFECCNE